MKRKQRSQPASAALFDLPRRAATPGVIGATTLLVACLGLGPLDVLATDSGAVRRCEAADGKVIYVNGPCPDDARAVRSLPVDTAPSPADRKAAQERTQKAKKVFEAQERAELSKQQKAQREKSALESKAQTLARDCGKLSLKVSFAREDLDRAASGKRPEFERKLARAQQSYDKSCKSPS